MNADDVTKDISGQGAGGNYAVSGTMRGLPAIGTDIDLHEKPIVPLDMSRLKPDEYYGHRGTTVFKLPHSSLEYEAIHGKQVYAPKISQDSPEHIRNQQVELENKITEQGKQIEVLVAALAGKEKEAEVAEEKMKPQPPLGNPGETLYENMAMKDLRSITKVRGLNSYQKSKKDIIEMLRENDSVNSTA